MHTVTLRVRSLVCFVTGAVLTLVVTLVFVDAWRVDAAPGETDSTFVPISPCRLADTRPAPNRVGTAAALGTDDTEIFAAHGGNGECVIPDDAVGLSMNVTAVGATLPTFLTVWPGGDRPEASSLNPVPGQPPVPNAVTTPLSGDGSFRVYNLQGSVEVIIDVNGYYTKSSLIELTSLGTRVAYEASVEIDEGVFAGGAADILTATITAPAAGTLVISASVDASGSSDDQYTCQVKVDGFIVPGSSRASRVNWAGVTATGPHTDNSQENCSSDAVTVVDAGQHAVDFRVFGRNTAAFHSGTLWVLWVPFDGTGAVPTP